MTVNLYKIRYIVEFIRRQGKLPTDQYGQVLCASDLLAWFGLSECLTVDELSYIEKELVGMIEAEIMMDKLKESEHVRADMD